MGGDITPGLGYPLRIRVFSLDILVSKPQELKLISRSGCAKHGRFTNYLDVCRSPLHDEQSLARTRSRG
jgi:hypothetical protein